MTYMDEPAAPEGAPKFTIKVTTDGFALGCLSLKLRGRSAPQSEEAMCQVAHCHAPSKLMGSLKATIFMVIQVN